jgi:[ribosomal protein S18]-alanine N-acetyltransferase
MNGPVKIAPAIAAEAEALARVHAASFDAPWTAADIAEVLGSPGGFALTVSDDEVRGFILARIISYEAEILTLAVAPDFRRRGLARALTDAAARLAESLGAESLFLEVAEDNPAAIALYAEAGFAQVGRRRGYYARGVAAPVDALVMRRDLNRRPG